MSSPNFLRVSTAVQVPLYRMADLPLMKSLAGSVPDFNGMYPVGDQPAEPGSPFDRLVGPFSTPSADL